MQQLKLLNFYKLISNISTNLVGAFIPLIVLQATGSIYFAILSYVMMFAIRLLFNFAFRSLYERYPQMVLMFRVVAVVLYSASIVIMDYYLWLGVFGATFFYGLDMSLRSVTREIIYNYASVENSGEKSPLGFSRLLEQVGVLVALVVGGVLLDLNKLLIIIISVVVYLISVIPLVWYFVKSRKAKTFNKDAISNARLSYDKQPELKQNAEKISKKILWMYAIVYFIYCFQDVLGNAFNIHIFLRTESFGAAGYLNAVYNAVYGVGCWLFSIIDSKKETTPLIIVSCIMCALSIGSTIIVNNVVWWYVAMVVAGLFFGFICTYMLGRLLPKCRIMGVSNNALFYRENAADCSCIVAMTMGCLTGGMVPVLISIVVTMFMSSIIIPFNEEKTRKQLINYLQNHEKAMSENLGNSDSQNEIIDATGESKNRTKTASRETTKTKK